MLFGQQDNDPNWREGARWKKPRSRIQNLGRKLEKLRVRVNADILAFYLACDPFVTPYLRCLAAPGARYPEACSHFRLRPLMAERDSEFYADATQDVLRSGGRNEDPLLALPETAPPHLFGDFVVREGVVSRGWFARHDPQNGRETALLIVNFRRLVRREEWDGLAPLLRSKFAGLLEQASEIQRKLQKNSYELIPTFLSMLEIVDPLRQGELSGGIPALMRELLRCAVLPLNGPDRRWCATVHRLTPDGKALELVASEGDFPLPSRTVHELAKGEGVISWVARRKQAIRIKDLLSSPFRFIRVEYLPDCRSQLAVPILRRGQLWGTLSLEATAPNAFRFQEVGYLTRIAGIAALAAAQFEFDHLREERNLYLEAIYEAKRPQALARPLPDFEELSRSAMGSILDL